MPNKSDQVHIYATGIIHCSVCAPSNMEIREVEEIVNTINPTGVGPWKITGEAFADGTPSPTNCDNDETRTHYLMSC
jgi:hypothetical protein